MHSRLQNEESDTLRQISGSLVTTVLSSAFFEPMLRHNGRTF